MASKKSTTSGRRELSLKDKVDLINEKERSNKSCRDLAKMFDIGKTQASQILKRKAEFMTAYEENAPSDRKRLKVAGDMEIDEMTWKWFEAARAAGVPVAGPMLQEKARSFAIALGKPDFKASNGWLDKFKGRHNINQATVCGESESVDLTVQSCCIVNSPPLYTHASVRSCFADYQCICTCTHTHSALCHVMLIHMTYIMT